MGTETDNSEYFTSYEDLDVHKIMLEDKPRNLAYKKAILENKDYFKDKIVMDVGCGTGILSIYCAQAGAKKVYAVEASNIAKLAKLVVKENGFENVIEVIQSKVENLTLPGNIKVDAIVSEWMGFYLLHEGMLDSVLYARDKFLKDNGQMFPDSAVIYVAPCSVPTLYNKWDDVDGVSMKVFAKHLRKSKHSKPEIISMNPEDLLGHEITLSWVNLKDDELSDLDSISIQHVVGANKDGLYQGLCIWFVCKFPDFSCTEDEESQYVLDTSPKSPVTHWKQTVIVLPEELEVEEGEPIAFQLDMEKDRFSRRRYNLQMTLLDPNAIEHPQPCSCDMTKCILIKSFMNQNTDPMESETNVLQEENVEDQQ
ncbi:protein arginine N-methyltransferase 6 [Manduca sexta]|uniref:type I protein arginine methyltransferase n=1 Tax=Manduca sexta TaxID=7130 RepID=A0A922CKK9_MANSE|nr:protein arginine N-methyltransferase 6 [Manduca sexta]KAG6449692.1 hypothetical protein O3G_MSEX006192 [Manduca sexta]